MWNSYFIAQLIALALAVAVLVILIVVLSRNSLPDTPTTEAKITKLDNKVNWLYAFEIASVGIMVIMGVITAFGLYNGYPCSK